MKFLHMSDLHIGKVVNDFSMLEDQKYMLDELVRLACEEKVDAVVIAGDIYDRSIPPADAVTVFDEFITQMIEWGISVILVAGNHDSGERIRFLENILCKQGVYIAGTVGNRLTCVTLQKDGSLTEFVLLPFCKPSQFACQTSQEMVQKLLGAYWEKEHDVPNLPKKRVLVTHFFVTDQGKLPELSESETTIHVGGIDHVDASVLDGFDYVALGHIHKMQQIGQTHAYYSGAPLQYSFGENGQDKGVLLVDMDAGEVQVEKRFLKPMREMRKIKGTLQELLDKGREGGQAREDYIQACLTDSGELLYPMETLRSVYPNVMQIVRSREGSDQQTDVQKRSMEGVLAAKKDPFTLFEEFYQEVQDTELDAEQKEVMRKLMRELEE